MSRDISKSSTNEIASRHLGASGSYSVQTDHFDSSLLVRIPRSEARKDWSITGLEFVGFDVWHCYEATFLLANGAPVAGTLKFRYPSYSNWIVESKSMKLYLNSFDMHKFGRHVTTSIQEYENQIKNDLSALLEVDVHVGFHHTNRLHEVQVNPFKQYPTLEFFMDIEDTVITDYRAEDDYHIADIPVNDGEVQEYFRRTNVLRSRCRHTKQKDTGTFFGYIKGRFLLNEVNLFKKIVSLRELDEFHEFCCEKLFVDMKSDNRVEELMIALLYSRRGSLDINPIRASKFELIPQEYIDVKTLVSRTAGQ